MARHKNGLCIEYYEKKKNDILNLFLRLKPSSTLAKLITQYQCIQQHYLNDDQTFREIFTNFYGLNNDKHLKIHKSFFFGLLHHLSFSNDDSFELYKYAIKAIGKKTKTDEVSYATKLVHTIDNTFPIVDKHVKNFFGFSTTYKFTNEHIYVLSQFYKKIVDEIKSKKKTANYFEKFRSIYQVDGRISDVKIIDFLILEQRRKI